MNCTGNLSTSCDKLKAFFDKYTPAEVDALISDAMLEMQAEIQNGSLNGLTGVTFTSTGKYGYAHALEVQLALSNAKEEGVTDFMCIAFMSLAYFYEKELDARGTDDVASWNLDSRLDFLVPLMFARKFLQIYG